jgi:hypothetical protein
VTKENRLNILNSGEITILGQFNWGSNFTFLVSVEYGSEKIEAVYKPQRGERPLWDFPADTLAGREVAAYLVSEALGWDLVPPTTFREDGPLGPGSLQLRVVHDPEQHYFTFDEATRQRLRPTALFDLVINNADRKGGHILIGDAGKLWLIDHGICFHTEPKLRTVVWDFVGGPTPADLMNSLQNLQTNTDLKRSFRRFLSEEEIAALDARIAALLAAGVFPAPPEDERSTPWPLV